MHIAEGVLSVPVIVSTSALALVGLSIGLRSLKELDRLLVTSLMSALFFLLSLFHLPLGGASVHLVMNGLLGIILGFAAFPAIFIALLFEAFLFQFGGLTTLGVNTLSMGAGALVGYAAFAITVRLHGPLYLGGFMAGVLSLIVSSLLTALALALSEGEFLTLAKVLLLAHVPLMIFEGVLTALVVTMVARRAPSLLNR